MAHRPLVFAVLALAAGCSKPTPASPPAAGSASGATAGPATTAWAKPAGAQVTQASGARIALADVTSRHAQTVLVFYRGFW